MLSHTEAIFVPIAVCLGLTVALGALLRRHVLSLGLPFAYCALLLLEHLPGAWAASFANESHARTLFVQTGIMLTAIGLCAFVGGVWISRQTLEKSGAARNQGQILSFLGAVPKEFFVFCLVGGWILTFAVRFLINVPSVNAIVEKGGVVWLLAVMLGLGWSVKRRSAKALLWGLALLVYPAFVLVVGGFMSWGSASIVIVMSFFCVVVKRYAIFLLGCVVAAVVGMSLFVNYFEIRTDLRNAAWGGAPISERASLAAGIFTDFDLVSPDNPKDLEALDKRLNQNYFIGVAAERLKRGDVDFLWGQSIWEGAVAVVPRIIWPSKPVFGGSGSIVRDMTGLPLERENTAWGVGSVMEFYVNFGVVGLIGGFLVLGFTLARLDAGAARNLAAGDYGRTLVYFLPCVALIQPLGSLVELSGGAAAALLAGFAWRWAWVHVSWKTGKHGPRKAAAAKVSRPTSHGSPHGVPPRRPAVRDA